MLAAWARRGESTLGYFLTLKVATRDVFNAKSTVRQKIETAELLVIDGTYLLKPATPKEKQLILEIAESRKGAVVELLKTRLLSGRPTIFAFEGCFADLQYRVGERPAAYLRENWAMVQTEQLTAAAVEQRGGSLRAGGTDSDPQPAALRRKADDVHPAAAAKEACKQMGVIGIDNHRLAQEAIEAGAKKLGKPASEVAECLIMRRRAYEKTDKGRGEFAQGFKTWAADLGNWVDKAKWEDGETPTVAKLKAELEADRLAHTRDGAGMYRYKCEKLRSFNSGRWAIGVANSQDALGIVDFVNEQKIPFRDYAPEDLHLYTDAIWREYKRCNFADDMLFLAGGIEKTGPFIQQYLRVALPR